MSTYIALTCSALARSVYAAAATAPGVVSVRLLHQGLHNTPRKLRMTLQDEIDSIQPGETDAILLAYGICGTSTLGLCARHTPLIIPRAHDCITLYLGSHQRYQQEFDAHPGTYWYSRDYLEHSQGMVGLGAVSSGLMEGLYEEYVKMYGEDNADYLMEVLGEWGKHYNRAVFIDMSTDGEDFFEQIARDQAERRGWQFERREGNRRLIHMLIHGQWSEEEFLKVPPGYRIEQTSDDGLIQAVTGD